MNEMNAMQKRTMEMTNMQRQMMQKQMNQMNAVKCWPGQFGTTHNATARPVNLPGLPTTPLLPSNEGMHTPLQEGRNLTSDDLDTTHQENATNRSLTWT